MKQTSHVISHVSIDIKVYEYKSSLLFYLLWFIFSDFTMILLCLRTLPICDRSFQKWVQHPSHLPWKQQMLLFVSTLPTSSNMSWVWSLGIHESQELGFSHTMVLSKSGMTYCFLKLPKSDRYLPYTSLMTFFFSPILYWVSRRRSIFCYPIISPREKLMQRRLDVVEVVDLRSRAVQK